MATDEKLADYLRRRDELFRNPTIEGIRAMLGEASGGRSPSSDSVALAAFHKARLQWTGATDAMRMQSMSWLLSNGFQTDIGAFR